MVGVLLIISTSANVMSQEYVLPLGENPVLREKHNVAKSKNVLASYLPFFDDFSYDDVYPSQNLWIDNDVYVNNDLAYNPISYGVATFDALDDKGMIHGDINSIQSNVADYLTSQPIRLDSLFVDGVAVRPYVPGDSIYLSFFFQPLKKMENSSNEQRGDSLCLQFFSSTDSSWHNVWGSDRFPFNDIIPENNKGRHFIEVIIPVTDTALYFRKDFQFRFYNKARLTESGNGQYPGWQNNASRWNIDYVYLNHQRRNDEYYQDVCFASAPSSFLKNYHSMPYKQYKASQNIYDNMVDTTYMYVSNLDKSPQNVTYGYEVVNDYNNSVVFSHNSGLQNINPFYNPSSQLINGAKLYYTSVFPNIFPANDNDSASFTIRYTLGGTNFVNGTNDSLTFVQRLYNYYAYDDGTPEYAYVLDGTVMFCQRYKLNVEDTLQAVKIYFNAMANEAGATNEPCTYELMIWNDAQSKPGNVVYQQNIVVRYDSVNKAQYHLFRLDDPLFVDGTNFNNLVFYVGLRKDRYTPISVGFDVSRNASSYTFVNSNGETWQKSTKNGSVMMRPLLGEPVPEEVGIRLPYGNDDKQFRVFPNPATGNVCNLKFENIPGEKIIAVYNHQGIMVDVFKTLQNDCQLNVNDYAKGLYVVVMQSGDVMLSKKLIVL